MKRVLVVEDLPQVAEHLKGMLQSAPEVEIAGVQTTGALALQQATSERPDVVMIDALLQDKKMPPLELAKRIRAASPATRIVIVTVPKAPVTPRPDQGIDAVFVLPGAVNELSDAIGAKKETERIGKGEVTAVFSPQGGSGKTTIALNLACHMRRAGLVVALMDAVMQFGSVREIIETSPGVRSIVDLPAGAGMAAALGEALLEGPGGVTLLLAPPRPEEADLVASSEIANAIGQLAGKFAHVIVDTPSRLSEDVLAALDSATAIILVITYDNAAVNHARATLDTFEPLGYRGRKPILVVVNRADVTAGLSKGAVEHVLGVPIAAEIPSDPKLVPEAANRRSPFVLSAPTSAVSKAIANLSSVLLAQQRR